MRCRRNMWLMVLCALVMGFVTHGYSQDNFLPGDKAEAILGSTDQTGIQVVKAGTSVILKGVCKSADTKFLVWRLQQEFSNITDLTILSPEAETALRKMEESFSSDLALSFSQAKSEQIASDLRFKLVEGRLVISGSANNQGDIDKIKSIAQIYDKKPVVNVDVRKEMLEIDVIFCRIQRKDGTSIGTKGLQSVKMEVPTIGYNFTSAEATKSAGDAFNNKNGTYTSVDHRTGVSVGTQTELASGALANTLTANFGVTEDDIKILVRPHLSTLNGQEAVFHSGGQQPFTIINQQAQNVEWKDYGTKLTIKPTLTSDGLIEVEVYIELTIPINDKDNRFTKFSHKGQAVLKDNEALVLSGLVQQIYKANVQRTPFLSRIPIIGFFFGYDGKDTDSEEMVVVVMPRRPVTAKMPVKEAMVGSDQLQDIISDTAADLSRPMGKSRRAVQKK